MLDLGGIVKEFVAESGEMLDQLERELIALERNPSSPETLASLFRSLHTIKGAAGFMGFHRLEALAHSGESVLSRLRDGSLTINPVVTSGLLALSDSIRAMLSQVDQTGQEGDADNALIVLQLARLQQEGAPQADLSGDPASTPVETIRQAAVAGSVRVSVELLDALMNLVGELVIARNEIVQLTATESHAPLRRTSQRLSAITTQLQEGIMKTRMQPIDDAWSKLPRVVRDAAQQCGKRVRLEMTGADIELDRTLIEAIQSPMTHFVRNCVDHGLETPEQRVAAGKPPEGCLSLRALHEGGQVTIEISDDGAGVDVAAIRSQALERGLITLDQARDMNEQDITNLIFLPGLSTAAIVTSLSGRGVGMDVVKTNIEQIGGKVTVQSEAGVGTTLRMRIPLTLAIVTALFAADGDQCYAVPQANVVELVRLEAGEAGRTIEIVGPSAIYRLRGEQLPLVWLSAQLAGRPRPSAVDRVMPSGATIVVLEADGGRFGLIVDDVSDAQEIVVKPLGRHLVNTAIFAGATIMGDGRVVLILDVAALAAKARVVSDWRGSPAWHAGVAREATGEPTESLLLCAGAGGMRIAVPLSQISRLADFAWSSIAHDSGGQAVPYLGGMLPLTDITSLIPASGDAAPPPSEGTEASDATDEPLHTIVHSKDGRQVGVIVDRVLDTVEERISRLRPDAGWELAESMMIDGHLTRILDLDALCSQDRFAGHDLAGPGA